MTRILVTGGSGFIGKHLASALIARGRQVRVLDLQPPPRALPQAEYVRGSVLDRDLVDRAMDGVDEVYHLAGLPGMWVPRKADFHAVNFGGTEIVIETARKRGIKRFLHCSTESILFRASPTIVPVADDALLPDDMPGPYTRSKMLADRFAMQAATSGYPVIIGCPTMPVGPHDHNMIPRRRRAGPGETAGRPSRRLRGHRARTPTHEPGQQRGRVRSGSPGRSLPMAVGSVTRRSRRGAREATSSRTCAGSSRSQRPGALISMRMQRARYSAAPSRSTPGPQAARRRPRARGTGAGSRR